MADIQYDFNKRVAVVTGGLNGIGAAIVEQLLAAQATVIVWDLAAAPETAETSGVGHCQVDIASQSSVEAALRDTLSQHGQIDFLINSAGFAGATVPLVDYDVAEWQKIIDVNLVGTFKVCRAVIPGMQKRNTGRVINLASLAGKEGTPNASAYSAAKAGVIALTKSLGKELALTHIRVNSIAPAAVKTSILDQMAPEHVEVMINKSPMKRLGQPQEVAEMVMWLCSDACSFSSGAVFDLSGGRATY